jgi:hypothetical protein
MRPRLYFLAFLLNPWVTWLRLRRGCILTLCCPEQQCWEVRCDPCMEEEMRASTIFK